MSSIETNSSYCLVFNIPSNYRSKHLRNYFNEYIEKQVFNCFHFRHRPQDLKTSLTTAATTSHTDTDHRLTDTLKQVKRYLAIVDIKSDYLNDFINKFNDKFWVDFDNDRDFAFKCFIKRIKVEDNCHQTLDPLRKAIEISATFGRHRNRQLRDKLKEQSGSAATREQEVSLDVSGGDLALTLSALKSLRELNPPVDVMPNGNVGTPLTVFLQLIRECRLPAPVIAKLELDFPKSMKRRIYSKVDYNYPQNRRQYLKPRPKSDNKSIDKLVSIDSASDCNNTSDDKNVDLVKTRNGLIINDNYSSIGKSMKLNDKQIDNKKCEKTDDRDDREELDESEEEEEWDRYEALHDDVTQQERNSERLFEEEIELKWEKGGSGLVFYTDAQFWDIKDNYEDYNEKTPDDWDLDLSVYRKNCSADKEAIDLKTLTDETKLRKGKRKFNKYSVDSVFDKRICGDKIGAFEKHTKGFGRKLMESQGWKLGTGLGQSVSGIPEPIEDCGQMPTDKRGFGYRGEKLKSYQYIKSDYNTKNE